MTSTWRRRAAVVAGFSIATVVLAAPWSLHPATRILADDADTFLTMWALGWDAHALGTAPWRIFDANIFHPNANTLAYSEHFIGSALLVAPLVWATGNLVLAVNVASLLACVLCGLGAYTLARRLQASPWAAVVAGVVFAFSPARFFRMSQLHVNAVQWMPFGLAALHAYFDTRQARYLRYALAFLSAQALTSGHGAAFTSVAYAALSVFSVARGAPVAVVQRIKDVGLVGLLALSPIALLARHYLQAQREVGLRRTLENWTVTPESFIASPSIVHQYVLSLVTDRQVNDVASAFLFPGVLVLALASLAFLRRAVADDGVPRRHIVFYGLLTVLTVLLYVAGPLSLWPWVYAWPGFNFVRVPSRFVVLTVLALAMLAGAGFDRITAHWPARSRRLAGVAAVLLLLNEFTATPFVGRDFQVQVPEADRWLATQPLPMVVAEVPVPDIGNAGRFERYQTTAMLHTTVHWRPTIAGYSGIRPERHERAFRALRTFPDEASLTALRDLGVTHVVVHVDRYDQADWPQTAAALAATSALRLVHDSAEGRVYALRSAQ